MALRTTFLLKLSSGILTALVLLAQGAFAANKIIGGREVEPTHPLVDSVVALVASTEAGESESFEICTASFLTNRVLLTAAHCLPDLEIGEEPVGLYVNTGVDANGSGVRLKVDRVLGHEAYDATELTMDVALVRLEKPYRQAKPLRLARPSDLRGHSAQRLARLEALGFGRSNAGRGEQESNEGLGRLRSVQLHAIDFFTESVDREPAIQVDMNHGRGFCEGDSGGPALLTSGRGRGSIIGIASSFESRGSMDCDEWGYYTNVLPHLDWISRKVREIEKLLGHVQR